MSGYDVKREMQRDQAYKPDMTLEEMQAIKEKNFKAFSLKSRIKKALEESGAKVESH